MTVETEQDLLGDFVRALKSRSADYSCGIPARLIPMEDVTTPEVVNRAGSGVAARTSVSEDRSSNAGVQACIGLRLRSGNPQARRIFFALKADLTKDTLELFERMVSRGLGLRIVDVALYEIETNIQPDAVQRNSAAAESLEAGTLPSHFVIFNFKWNVLKEYLASSLSEELLRECTKTSNILQTFSLHEIASDPEKKKIFWTALKNQVQ